MRAALFAAEALPACLTVAPLSRRCTTFADLRRLAAAMHAIADKFEMFDAAKARPFLLDFKWNYERIESGLKECWAKIEDEASKRGEILGLLAKANEALREEAALGAHFVRRDASTAVGPELSCNHCGATGPRSAFDDYPGHNGQYKKCPNQQCGQPFPADPRLHGGAAKNMASD